MSNQIHFAWKASGATFVMKLSLLLQLSSILLAGTILSRKRWQNFRKWTRSQGRHTRTIHR